AGCSPGTSAAVTVALLAALDALTPGRMTPHELAASAHRVETEDLGWQSGIQDQLCSAYGGINFVAMSRYPDATVSPLTLPDEVWWELDRRMSLVFLGRPHRSSPTHDKVIAELTDEGGSSPRLARLRDGAVAARDALARRDLDGLARAMIDNTEAQAA